MSYYRSGISQPSPLAPRVWVVSITFRHPHPPWCCWSAADVSPAVWSPKLSAVGAGPVATCAACPPDRGRGSCRREFPGENPENYRNLTHVTWGLYGDHGELDVYFCDEINDIIHHGLIEGGNLKNTCFLSVSLEPLISCPILPPKKRDSLWTMKVKIGIIHIDHMDA